MSAIYAVLGILCLAAIAMIATAKLYQWALLKEAERREAKEEWRNVRYGLFFVAALLFAAASVVVHDQADAAGLPPRCAKLMPLFEKAYRGHPIAAGALAGQIYQESSCRADAVSHAGARGLAQFTLPTEREMAHRYGIVCPWNDPACAVKRQTKYMGQLFNSKTAREMLTKCDRWATAAAAYNSGLGWQNRNRRATAKAGGNPRRYWSKHDGIQKYHDPNWAAWAADENTAYVRHILRRQEAFANYGFAGEC